MLLETSSATRATGRRGSMSHDAQSIGSSANSKRVITIATPGDGMKKNRLAMNMTKLKRAVAKVGKAAMMLEMMKPSMITHKKGTKPANYDACKAVLSKSQYLRTTAECTKLLELVKNVKFFKSMAAGAQLELCKVMNHLDVAWARQTIMQQGDPGTQFYVILVGSFYVQIQVSDSKNLKTVAHLHPGDSFGEAALISNNPRNATVVSAEPSELLMIEKADYERVVKRLHVDELNKKASFVRGIPAFQTFADDIVKDLASRVFFEKVGIHTNIWKQGDAVDPMRYLMIVKHGEVHVIKNFRVKKKKRRDMSISNKRVEEEDFSTQTFTAKRRGGTVVKAALTGARTAAMSQRQTIAGAVQGCEYMPKRADLCILGVNAAFLERGMLESSKADMKKDAAEELEERIMTETQSENRGCTLVAGCACEVGWLSKHVFNQLTHYGTTLVETMGSQNANMSRQAEQLMADLSEWIIEYPTEKELVLLYSEDKLWKEFKENVVLQAKAESSTKRGQWLRQVGQEEDIIAKIREAKYGDHPLSCDLKLPFRKPVDLLPMSQNTDIRAPEFNLAPSSLIYGQVAKHLIPKTLVKKVYVDDAKTFGYVSPGRGWEGKKEAFQSPRPPGGEKEKGSPRTTLKGSPKGSPRLSVPSQAECKQRNTASKESGGAVRVGEASRRTINLKEGAAGVSAEKHKEIKKQLLCKTV